MHVMVPDGSGHLLSIAQILDIISEPDDDGNLYTGKLEIESDSCYSGKICFDAKKEWEKRKLAGTLKIKSLSVFASCHKDLASIWGKYNNYKTSIKRNEMSKDIAKAITLEYSN